ncbi:MAG: hypothetical protein IJ218_07140 [Alphaproteobacteria bacterium]|nr:hypothetical protein [Alphaproteobacteria bacterium]
MRQLTAICMKQITFDDVRATLYEMKIPAVSNIAIDELHQADFMSDLQMNEQQVLTFMVKIERKYRVILPVGILDSLRRKNTVQTFIISANHHLIDLDD